MADTKTLVVAEPGCTHEGSWDKLVALARMAATCGADVFKAQWCSDPDALAVRRRAPDYLPFYQWLKFPPAWHVALARECAALGIEYACTVYLPDDVAVVDPVVRRYKVASFESCADDLLAAYADRMAGNDKRLIVSQGHGVAIDFSSGPWAPFADVRDRVDVLRCVAAYPAPIDELHLETIRAQGLAGLSDHSAPYLTTTGALAVTSGARIVERHVRLDSASPSNPDYVVAMSDHGFAEYVRQIRMAERIRGDGATVAAQPAETASARFRVQPPVKASITEPRQTKEQP